MSNKLIASLLKRSNPEKDVLKKSIENSSRDEDVNELKSLYQIPKREVRQEMPHYQIFKDGLQQADLLFMPMDNKMNYALVVVDIHSRRCDAEPITIKASEYIVRAFEKIYKRKILKKPIMITFDNGKEFKGETRDYFEEQDIKIKYAETNRHRQVALVEAKNKMIGSTLHKLMALLELKTDKESRKWVEHLPGLITEINKALPPPIDTQLIDEPYTSKSNEDVLTIGSRVRTKLDYPFNIVNEKRLIGVFRSSDIRWSREVKKIANIIIKPGFPVMYQIGDEPIHRTRNEIQVVEEIDYV